MSRFFRGRLAIHAPFTRLMTEFFNRHIARIFTVSRYRRFRADEIARKTEKAVCEQCESQKTAIKNLAIYSFFIKTLFFIFLRDFICLKHCIIFYGKNNRERANKTIIRAGKILFAIVVLTIFGAIYTEFFKKNDILFEKFLDLCYTVPMEIYAVKRRTKRLCEKLMRIWETSVKATHTFLSDEERAKIGLYVPQAIKSIRHDP